MAVALNVLLLEDRPEDAELLLRELRRAGFEPKWKRFETEADFRSSLEAERPEIILADHSMPQFGAKRALEILQEQHIDIPVILVSGTIGEEEAVSIIKRGAVDYILKDRPARLGDAVRRALEERRLQEEKQGAETALREAEAKYRRLVEQLPIIVYINPIDQIKHTTYISPQIETILGFTPEEWLSSSEFWQTRLHPEDREQVLKRVTEVNQTGESFDMEYRMTARDGHVVWFQDHGVLIRDDNGQPLFWQGLQIDITERKNAEQALRGAETRFRLLVERIPAIVYVVSDETPQRTLYVSPQIKDILGFTPKEWTADPDSWSKQVHPDDLERVLAEDKASHAEGRSFIAEYRIHTKDGRIVWLHDETHHITEPGLPPFSQGIEFDITDRKLAEEALRDSEERYRFLFERNPQPMWVYDEKNLNFLAVNDAAIEHYGYSRDEFLSMTIRAMRPAEELTFLEQNLAEVRQPREKSGPWKHRKKDGTIISVEIISHQLDFMGKSARLVLVNDITDRLRAEADTRQRLAELEAINRVSTALRMAQTLDEMLPHFLEETIVALNGSAGAIWLLDSLSNEIRPVYERGWNFTPAPVRLGEGIPGYVVASGEPYVSKEIKADSKLHEAVRNQVPAGRGGACVPIRSTNKVIGALFVNVELPREISEEDLHLLTTLAEIAGNAINRVGLYENTLKQLERLAALRTIDITITSSLDLNMTLNVLLDQVIRQLNVDAAAILLQNPETKNLRFAAGKGFWTHDVESTNLRLGEGLAHRAVIERKIVHIGNLKAHNETIKRPELMADEKFVSYYAVPLIAKGKIKGVLELFHRSNLARDPEWMEFMEALGNQAAIAVDNSSLFQDLQRSNLDLALAYDATIEGWSHALDLRDKETEGHTQRVTETTIKLAQKMGIPDEDLVHVRRGALLHDIGKMGVPDNILLKPGKLTDEEWEIMRRHPQYAFDLLTPISYLRRSLDIPFCHHEKWDGTGYPRGLKSEEIPLVARIFAVVDVWDAVTSDRPYRPAWSREQALKYIGDQSGSHFDPRVVQAFLDMQADR